MLADLVRALPAGAAAAVLPGYFWAMVLRPTGGIGERLAYSTGISMAAVPAVAVLLARATGSGIALWTALVAVLLVFGSGVAFHRWKGTASGTAAPLLPRPGVIRDPVTLTLLSADLVLAFGVTLERQRLSGLATVLLLAGLVLAGVVIAQRPPADAGAAAPAGDAGVPESRSLSWLANPRMGDLGLAIVLAVTVLVALAGVIRVDWPFIPGGDQFSHAVMAEQMMLHGQYHSYLVYPPGFSALTAVICRFAGLAPLALFPVLASAMLLLPPLAAYALATRLWGWEYGLAAAVLSGLVFTGSYTSLMWGRYPDLVSSSFLLVMAVAALVGLYESPTVRSGVLLAVLAASVVLYHSVATLYLAILLALVGLIGLPYLVLTRRLRDARALLLGLAGIGALSVLYAAYIYDLPAMLGGKSAASTAVSIAVGTQAPLPVSHILSDISPGVAWFGLLGVTLLVAGIRRLRQPSQVLAAATVAGWVVFMYLGSRTAADGFPQRFDRDVGAPLCVAGALALGVIGRSAVHAWRGRQAAAAPAAAGPGNGAAAGTASPATASPAPASPATARTATSLAASATAVIAAVLTCLILAIQFGSTVTRENHRWGEILTPADAAAGRWLAKHNTGGTVISTPYLSSQIGNRAVLALGWYTGLQAYTPKRIKQPRSLPTAGKQPLLDTQTVLEHPESCQAGNALVRDDVRYVVLYKTGPYVSRAGFVADPSRYQPVYRNNSITIYATVRTPCTTP